MRRTALALTLALLSSAALAQQVNDVQLRPGSSSLWGASFNANNNQVIDQFNTAGSVVDSFRWYQGTSTAAGTFLWSVSPTGMVAGAATGSRQGPGTINAQGVFVNGVSAITGIGGTNGQIQYNNNGVLGGFTTSGDATINTTSGALTLASVNGNIGTFGSATSCITTTANAKGLITAISAATCTPALGSITGLGAGVATALAIATGTNAGSFITYNGPAGTPSALVGTNITGTAAGLTAGTASAVAVGGITGLSANCGTWLATASSANLRSCMTDESGTGVLYFQGGDAGTPSALVGTNITGTAAGLTAGTFTAGSATNLTSGTLNSARLAWNGAVLQAAPANPTNTSSASGVMMGLGVTTCRFTPTFSTRARFEINGSVANTNVNGNSAFSLRYSTGAGPANGVAATGTQVGSSQTVTSSTANAQVAFIVTGLVTGLSAGTTYWFDTTLAVSAGTSAIISPNCAAYEL